MSSLTSIGYVRRNNHAFPLRTYAEVQQFMRNNPAINDEISGFAFKIDPNPAQPWLMTRLKKGDKSKTLTFEAVDPKTRARLQEHGRNLTYSVKADFPEASVDDVTVVFKTLTDGRLSVYYIVYNEVLLFTEDEIGAILPAQVFDVVPITAYNMLPFNTAFLAIPYSDKAIEFPYSSLPLMGVLGAYTTLTQKG